MPEPPADLNQPEPVRPAAPRRVVADWEYKTAYIPTFQVRIPAGLHDRLCEWARQDANHRQLSSSRFLRRRSAIAAGDLVAQRRAFVSTDAKYPSGQGPRCRQGVVPAGRMPIRPVERSPRPKDQNPSCPITISRQGVLVSFGRETVRNARSRARRFAVSARAPPSCRGCIRFRRRSG